MHGSASSRSSPERNWVALTLALALVSFVTAAVIAGAHGAAVAATGAVVLGLVFGLVALVSTVAGPVLVEELAAAWAEHRRYVWFSTGLFAFGVVLGAALVAAGVDLAEFFFELIVEEFEDEELDDGEFELTASLFIGQNTPPFLASIFGAVTLGILTAFIMVFNGVIVGNIATVIGLDVGFGPIVALLVPHGIFELSALFVAAGVGFRLLHRGIQRVTGARRALFTGAYLRRTGLLVVFAWFLLVLAAFVEAYVTIVVAELIFPDRLGEMAAPETEAVPAFVAVGR